MEYRLSPSRRIQRSPPLRNGSSQAAAIEPVGLFALTIDLLNLQTFGIVVDEPFDDKAPIQKSPLSAATYSPHYFRTIDNVRHFDRVNCLVTAVRQRLTHEGLLQINTSHSYRRSLLTKILRFIELLPNIEIRQFSEELRRHGAHDGGKMSANG